MLLLFLLKTYVNVRDLFSANRATSIKTQMLRVNPRSVLFSDYEMQGPFF